MTLKTSTSSESIANVPMTKCTAKGNQFTANVHVTNAPNQAPLMSMWLKQWKNKHDNCLEKELNLPRTGQIKHAINGSNIQLGQVKRKSNKHKKKEFMTSNAPASVPATNAPPVRSSNASAQEANTTN